ncbi:hypothetical protein GCM10023325_10130 [Sphingomonas lutea]|nr:ATP-grasp fold amidoligase family protein [Sphingomonas lutea]
MPAAALPRALGDAHRPPTARALSLLYLWRHGRWPDLERPRRFTEWVQWRKLNDRRVALARLTDKLQAKAIAAERLGDQHVVPVLWHGQRLPGTPHWPMPFVVKANHGCGQFVVVRNMADWRRARIRSFAWMRSTYGAALGEWHYGIARRALLVEPYLSSPIGCRWTTKSTSSAGARR